MYLRALVNIGAVGGPEEVATPVLQCPHSQTTDINNPAIKLTCSQDRLCFPSLVQESIFGGITINSRSPLTVFQEM